LTLTLAVVPSDLIYVPNLNKPRPQQYISQRMPGVMTIEKTKSTTGKMTRGITSAEILSMNPRKPRNIRKVGNSRTPGKMNKKEAGN
jgi:uncharacterized protein YwbE